MTERNLAAAKLATERNYWRTLFKAIPDSVCVKSPDNIYLACNRTFAWLLGATEAEVVGRQDSDFFPPEQVAKLRASDQRAIASGLLSITEEKGICAADGHYRQVEVIKTALHDSGGQLIGILAIGRDVTLVRQSQLALKESERRQQLALDTARAGIWEWRIDADSDYWSAEFWRLVELPPGSCRPDYQSWLRTIDPEDRERVDRIATDARARWVEFEVEWRVATQPDGRVRWLLTRGRPVIDGQGEPRRFIGISVDISALKQAEEKALQSQIVLRQAQGLAHMMPWRANLVTGMYEVVDEADVLPGWPKHRALAIEEFFEKIVDPEDLPLLRARWRAAVRLRPRQTRSPSLMSPSGTVISCPLLLTCRSYIGPDT